MADKLNKVDKEESISRVYQFLNKQKDWQATADRNNDGTIIKNEFRAFILSSNFKFNAGEDKNDLIDKFWSSIDSNSSGKISGGSGLSNKNALDGKEIAHINNSIEATGKVISYVNDKLQFPSGLDSSYQSKWKNSVKQGMINRASEFLKSATLEELTDEKLAEFARMSSVKATADYKAAEGVDELNREYGDIGYKAGSDEVRKSIIDEYISGLNGSENEADIISDVQKIMDAYIDTAKTNSSASTDLLAKYGYDASANLNPLQLAVLTKDMTESILDYIKQTNPEIYIEEYEEQIKTAVEAFVADYLSDKGADEFTSLKSFNVAEFAASDTYKTLAADIKEQIKDVLEARERLNTYAGELLARGDSEINAIVKEVLGSTDAVTIANSLLKMKTAAEINAKYDALFDRVESLTSTRAAQQAAAKEAASKPFDWDSVTDKYTGQIAKKEDQRDTYLQTKSLSDLYNENGVIDLMNVQGMKSCSFDTAKTTSIRTLTSFLKELKSALSGKSYDTTALETAANKVIALYSAAFDYARNNFPDKKDENTPSFVFGDEAYEYQFARYYYNSSAVYTGYSEGCSASNNQLGLRICNEYDDGEFKVLVNAKCIMDFLERFYREALG